MQPIYSKAAMYTILETLAMTVGVKLNELEAFYVAGTFASPTSNSASTRIS